jgi:hypothetical protein
MLGYRYISSPTSITRVSERVNRCTIQVWAIRVGQADMSQIDDPTWLRQSRLRIVSVIELLAWIIGLTIPTVMNIIDDIYHGGDNLLIALIRSLYSWPYNLLTVALIVIIIIFLTFRGQPLTLILEGVDNLLKGISTLRLGGISLELIRSRDAVAPTPDELTEMSLRTFVRRSEQVARTAKSRPQVLLFVGAMIAFGGLLFFVITLPQETGLLGQTFPSSKISPTGTNENTISPALLNELTPDDRHSILGIKTVTERFLSDVLPRLLMLVFIQVLAGFFLRQYRAGVEDFRYYEAVLRRRETESLAYGLYRAHPDDNNMKEYVKSLLSSQEFGIIKKGETTMVLEAAKASENELQTTIEKILSKIDIASFIKRS